MSKGNYRIRYVDYNKPTSPDLKFNAHLGFYGVAPENTIPAFELAGVCGFDSCITVPKVTKDGVFVCIHDDTINKRARDHSGNMPEEEMPVSDTLWPMEYNDDLIEKLSDLNLDLSKVRGVIEIREKLDTKNFNEDIVEKIKAAGFTPSALSCWGRKTGEYYRRLISLGVNEFTEDYHCSFGLNW